MSYVLKSYSQQIKSLNINVRDPIPLILRNQNIESVPDFTYLGNQITTDGVTSVCTKVKRKKDVSSKVMFSLYC